MEFLGSFLAGVPWTLGVTAAAFAMGALLGVPLVLMRRSRFVLVRIAARITTDVARGIPPIVWLFIIFFGIGAGVIRFNPFQASVIGLGIVSAAYLAEIYRAGFVALHPGQQEAATALGMTRTDTLSLILAPQVLRVAVPPATTYLVSLLKDSAVASTLGVADILYHSVQDAQASGGSIIPFVRAAAIYIVLSIPIAWYSRSLDRKLRGRVAR